MQYKGKVIAITLTRVSHSRHTQYLISRGGVSCIGAPRQHFRLARSTATQSIT